MSEIPTVHQIQQMSDAEVRELNRKLQRKVFLTIAGYAALKLTILLVIRRLAKTAAETN